MVRQQGRQVWEGGLREWATGASAYPTHF
jgi:hypothetical protein